MISTNVELFIQGQRDGSSKNIVFEVTYGRERTKRATRGRRAARANALGNNALGNTPLTATRVEVLLEAYGGVY